MKNPRRILFCAVLLLSLISFKGFAQTPEWLWAKSAGVLNDDQGNSIATDKSGNIYYTGSFASGFITFGDFTLFNASALGLENHDIYIVKYDAGGKEIWAKSIGGIERDAGVSITTDDNQNAYVTGEFWSPSIIFGKDTLYNTGSADIFIVKYDPNGNVLWARSAIGSAYDISHRISTDKSGNVYVSGYFVSDTLSFGNSMITNLNEGTLDIFMVKYNSEGNVIWTRTAGGNSQDAPTGFTIDQSGNLYLAGRFSSDSLILGTTVLYLSGNSNYDFDMFIAKYDANGDVLWAKSAGGRDIDGASGLASDGNGNIYVTGYFDSDSITFGSITLTKNNIDRFNIFISKYDENGNILWAKSADAGNNSGGDDIAVDSNGNAYIVGFYDSSIRFGPLSLENPASYDMFVVKFDSSGTLRWLTSGADGHSIIAKSIATDRNGNVYVGGYFVSSMLSFGTTNLKNEGSNDIYLAKLHSPATSSVPNYGIANFANIFPNPTASQFHITNLSPGNWTITIYTLDGQSVFKKEITESNSMIDLSGKAKGAYVYQLLKDGEVFKSGKIVLE